MAKKVKQQDYGVLNPVVFIPGNTPSLKNAKIKTKRGIFMSKTCVNYLRSLNIQSYSSSKKLVKGYASKDKPNLFKQAMEPLANAIIEQYPIILGFHFVRKTKADFDFNNANQILLDLMTAHDIIPDDCMKYVIPVPYQKDGAWYTVDKDNPGCYIRIINNIHYDY